MSMLTLIRIISNDSTLFYSRVFSIISNDLLF